MSPDETPKPVPLLGVLRENPDAPTPPLTEAFNRYWRTVDGATVPADDGDGRRIPDHNGAVLLSEVTDELHNALAAESGRLFAAHGREIDASAGPIHLSESDDPNGPWTPVPASAVTARVVSVGRGGADAAMMTALLRAMQATACPTERHNVQNAVKPGGPHQRYICGDVIPRDTLNVLESVGKLLRLNRSDDDDWRPGQWFTLETNIPTARLRQAANPKRKTKRVRKRTIDGVECYSVSDARQWWPDDMHKA